MAWRRVRNSPVSPFASHTHSGHFRAATPVVSYQHFGQRLRPRARSPLHHQPSQKSAKSKHISLEVWMAKMDIYQVMVQNNRVNGCPPFGHARCANHHRPNLMERKSNASDEIRGVVNDRWSFEIG
jgi:hypothetical protein